MEIVLCELLDDNESVDKGVSWLKYRLDSGAFVAFWGELRASNRNIISLRNQKLPVIVAIQEPEECMPTLHEQRDFGLSVSVPMDAAIEINPVV